MARTLQVTVDCADPDRLARFWAGALGYALEDPPAGFGTWRAYWLSIGVPEDELGDGDCNDSIVDPDGAGPRIWFQPVPEGKAVKNRLHFDLCSESFAAQEMSVARLTEHHGATVADIGQGTDVPWVVLADPEGNEFCVLEPRATYADTGPLAAIVMDAADPAALARFWAGASDWELVEAGVAVASLRGRSARGPFLEFVRVDEDKVTKNRLHLDIGVSGGRDVPMQTRKVRVDTEVDRLLDKGATTLRALHEPGVDHYAVVMQDPEGNEFCVN